MGTFHKVRLGVSILVDVPETLDLAGVVDRQPSTIQSTLDGFIAMQSYIRMYEERLGIPFPSDT